MTPLLDQLATVMNARELCAMIDDMNDERRDYTGARRWEVDREDDSQRNEAGNDGAC